MSAQSHQPVLAALMGATGLACLILIAFAIFLYWKIFSKAGYTGWLSMLLIVPIVNLIVIIWFAFADWPIIRQARGQAPRTV